MACSAARTCFPSSLPPLPLFLVPSSAASPPPGVLATRGSHKEYQRENDTNSRSRSPLGFKTMLMTLDDGMTVPFNVAFILAAATIGALGS